MKGSTTEKLQEVLIQKTHIKNKLKEIAKDISAFKEKLLKSLLPKLEILKLEVETKANEQVDLCKLENKKLAIKNQRLTSQLKIAQSGESLELESLNEQIKEMEQDLIEKQKIIKKLEDEAKAKEA